MLDGGNFNYALVFIDFVDNAPVTDSRVSPLRSHFQLIGNPGIEGTLRQFN
jgi:hypothetical protein